MHAIETLYKGFLFRSRLEARWAVFFDTLHLEWQYEVQGFDLDELGRYLPDFWLPGIGERGYWIEVKGEDPGWDCPAYEKLVRVCELTAQDGLLVYGDPYGNIQQAREEAEVDWKAAFHDGSGDNYRLFCVCPWCGKVGIEYAGRGARVCGWPAHHATEAEALTAIQHLGHWRADDKCFTGSDVTIEVAALTARQARFEHGACGTGVNLAGAKLEMLHLDGPDRRVRS